MPGPRTRQRPDCGVSGWTGALGARRQACQGSVRLGPWQRGLLASVPPAPLEFLAELLGQLGYARSHCIFQIGRHLLHDRAFLAESMSAYLRDEIAAADRVGVRYRSEVAGGGGEGRLAWLSLRDNAAGTTATVDAAGLFILIGARPHTSWLPPQIERDHWGFIMTGPDITTVAARPAQMYETSMPGVFAVGDTRHGSVKRVASAVGEGSVVIQQVLHYLTEMRQRTEPAR